MNVTGPAQSRPQSNERFCWGTGRKKAVREKECNDNDQRRRRKRRNTGTASKHVVYTIFVSIPQTSNTASDFHILVNSRMQPWLKTLVAAKHHQPNKTPLPGNYSPASWGRRRTVLRSAACRPAGAPSPPSWFRKAGRRRKHVRKPVTRTEMFDTIKPLTTERWKQGKFSCFV